MHPEMVEKKGGEGMAPSLCSKEKKDLMSSSLTRGVNPDGQGGAIFGFSS